jgi:hypothetical protein
VRRNRYPAAILVAAGAGDKGGFSPSQLGNLAAWYKLGLGITITGSGVSQWSDASGNARHLLQGTDASRPVLQGDNSILFDGVDDFLKASAFTLNQPITIYVRLKQITWTSGDAIFDGDTLDKNSLRQVGASPQLEIFGGTSFSAPDGNLALGAYGSVASVFNGVSSSLRVNNNAPITGSFGAAASGGFILGAKETSSAWANVQVKETIIYSVAHSTAQQDIVIAYLGTL